MLVGKKRTILGNCRWRISPEGCLRFHSGTRPSSKRTSNHLHVISAPLERKILPHGSGTIAPASHHSSSDGTFTPLMMAEELLPFLRCFHNPGKRFNLDLIVLRKGSFWAINERPNSSSRSPSNTTTPDDNELWGCAYSSSSPSHSRRIKRKSFPEKVSTH